ncbi:dienelactone hydrolase family protein [Saccharospirillum mangrovi]|uniref:dienelactone hydrolase family protein n=1 Tax=Saccharospirillum mangrovi TaxID=2161747 RepID=UPI000D346375|nr:dienelactone hydrolase family protein [Saccharospirillum mangrovi]
MNSPVSASMPPGYDAPSHSEAAPGVLVLHAWWGLNDDVRRYCDALAQAGFHAFAPDLYQGQVVTTIDAAEAAANAMDRQQAMATMEQAAHWLAQQTGETESGVAAVGFSLGAFQGLGLSIAQPSLLHSVVSYYAARPDEYQAATARYQAHLADDDPFATDEEIDEWRDALQQAGRPLDLHRYPGTGHWFAEPLRSDVYQPEAADMAFQRTLAFLRAGAED